MWLSIAILLHAAAPPVSPQSLGDAARAQREKQDQGTKKAAKVYTNDDFPSANKEPEQPTPTAPSGLSAPSPPVSVPTLSVEANNGWSMPLAPDSATDLVFMATWCPHSKALKDILNDPRSRPYWSERKLVFLFSKNEWARVKSSLEDMAKRGKIPESAVEAKLEQLKRQAGSPYVVDPKFLNDLPGDYYLCLPPKEVTGYPRVLSVRGYAKARDWLVRDLKMPEDLFEKLRADYDPDTSSSSGK
jgi:hypothetical protein